MEDEINKKRKNKGKKSKFRSILLSVSVVILMAVLTVCGYYIYKEMSVYKKGSDEYSRLVEIVNDGNQGKTPLHRVIDFPALQKINNDIVGWLYLPNTVLDYPVVLGKDNDYYLDTLFSGQKNKAGTIFMDYRNKEDFSDDNTIFYGHNMKNKSMFNIITKYKKQEFYNNNKIIYYYTIDGVYEFRIFSAFTTNANDSYTKIDYGNDKEAELKALAARSAIATDQKLTGKENIVTLSTCTYEYEDARFVVQASVHKMPYGGNKG